jgi:beta-N-acetylhexosaminidase
MNKKFHLGPIMMDVEGLTLTDDDKTILQHPLIGGVILFTRNYQNKNQLYDLIQSIREVRKELLIAVDQEGGRVQRFREGFLALPAMQQIGEVYAKDAAEGRVLATSCGKTMAAELVALDIDFSFAPVLDLNLKLNTVIASRAFSSSAEVVAELGTCFMTGMHEAGMVAVGKHFPGHGSVTVDSHYQIPLSSLEIADPIFEQGIFPFKKLIEAGIKGLMPAHIIFKEIDKYPTGFSVYWLQTMLRQELGFEGAIFSDDLSMEGASAVGGIEERAKLALTAGCDMILICNNRESVQRVLGSLDDTREASSQIRLKKMHHE